jgi:valyl-tRNA synthetase
MLARLAAVVEEATAEFDAYDHARALEVTESFFWSYCDDYLELVKARAYGDPSEDGPASARYALALSLSVTLRLFAPFLPYCTEEAWSWWQSGSIHAAPWPSSVALAATAGAEARPGLLEALAVVLVAVRRAKTEAKGSMRTQVARCVVAGPPSLLELVGLASGDLAEAGAISQLDLASDPGATALSVSVELAPGESPGPETGRGPRQPD